MSGSTVEKVTPRISPATAEVFLLAFDEDDIDYWIEALHRWEDDGCPESGDGLTDAVAELRRVWWHDGSNIGRAKVHAAAAKLRSAIAGAL